jgi:hypothetical protein
LSKGSVVEACKDLTGEEPRLISSASGDMADGTATEEDCCGTNLSPVFGTA